MELAWQRPRSTATGKARPSASPRTASRSRRFFFVRHGESEANLLREFSNRGDKHGLTSRGREQMLELADRRSNANISRIYASPVRRARESAELLGVRLAVEWCTEEALREYDVGTFEGTSSTANWDAYEQVVAAWLLGRDWDQRTGGGESLREIEARFMPFVDRLRVEVLPGAPVLLLGHASPARPCASMIGSTVREG
jgi:broad specificity phosphatase PhoE